MGYNHYRSPYLYNIYKDLHFAIVEALTKRLLRSYTPKKQFSQKNIYNKPALRKEVSEQVSVMIIKWIQNPKQKIPATKAKTTAILSMTYAI